MKVGRGRTMADINNGIKNSALKIRSNYERTAIPVYEQRIEKHN